MLWEASEKKIPGDPFSKSDLNCFLSCVYDLRTGGEKKGFDRKIFLSSFFFHLWNRWENQVGEKKFYHDNF